MKKNKLLLLTVFLILATGAMASATNMPWEGPLDKLLKSLTGPVARTVIILALAGTGGTLAF